MPVGTIIHNVELKAGKGGQLARSAGTYAQLIGRDQGYALIRLSSGEQRMVRGECMIRATIDALNNIVSPRQVAAKRGKKVSEIVSRRVQTNDGAAAAASE